MSKVTPRPWTAAVKGNIGTVGNLEVWIVVEHPKWGEVSLASVRSGCDEAEELGDPRSNAAHIVKCVNMHEELVAAIEKADAHLKAVWLKGRDIEPPLLGLILEDLLRRARGG